MSPLTATLAGSSFFEIMSLDIRPPTLYPIRTIGPGGPSWLGKPGGFQLWIYCA
jgi:hypothetical protein